jgi:hypothetical protein
MDPGPIGRHRAQSHSIKLCGEVENRNRKGRDSIHSLLPRLYRILTQQCQIIYIDGLTPYTWAEVLDEYAILEVRNVMAPITPFQPLNTRILAVAAIRRRVSIRTELWRQLDECQVRSGEVFTGR